MLINENELLGEDNIQETLEGDQLIMEAILEDAGCELSEDDAFELISEQLLSERSVVRLDKHAKRALAEKKSVIVLAKEANDPLYKKLVTVYKMKKKIIDKLVQKYSARAKTRVRKNMQNKKASGIVKRTATAAKTASLFKGSDIPTKRK